MNNCQHNIFLLPKERLTLVVLRSKAYVGTYIENGNKSIDWGNFKTSNAGHVPRAKERHIDQHKLQLTMFQKLINKKKK